MANKSNAKAARRTALGTAIAGSLLLAAAGPNAVAANTSVFKNDQAFQVATCKACNPCAAKKACNPCNPCAAKKKKW